MRLSDLFGNPVYRRVLGLLLLFVSFVVFPALYGVGPLSTTVATSVVSVDYDPSSGLLLGTVDLFQGVTSPFEIVQLTLSPASSSAYSVDIEPVTLSASITSSRIEYRYIKSDSLPYARCYSAVGSDSIGAVYLQDDFINAVRDAVSQLPEPVGSFRYIIDGSWTEDSFLGIFGGTVYVRVYMCEYVDGYFALYNYSGSPELRSCFTLSLKNKAGEVAVTDVICNDVSASTSFDLKTADGRSVGTVIYSGWKKSYWPPEVSTPPGAYLLVERPEINNVVATGVYLVPSDAATVINSYLTLASDIRRIVTTPPPSLSILQSFADQVASSLGLPQGSVVTMRNYSGGVYVEYLSFGDSQYSVADLNTLVERSNAYLSQLRSSPVSNVSFAVDGTPSVITLYRDVTNYSSPLASHQLLLRLNADFAGLKYVRAEPEILSVSPGADCTDKLCILDVRLRNRSDVGGPVTIAVSGRYISGQTTTTLAPLEEKVVSVRTVPSGVDRSVVDDVTVTVFAPHPISPYKDVYNVSVQIQKSATCTLLEPVCSYDQNRGAWFFVQCSDVYSDPIKTYCAEGQGCVNGVGCVDDFLTSVECVDSRTYRLVYQYSGEQLGVCSETQICDADLASQNVVPPCSEVDICQLYPDLPQCGGGEVPSEPVYHVVYERSFMKDIAIGLALIGLALVII